MQGMSEEFMEGTSSQDYQGPTFLHHFQRPSLYPSPLMLMQARYKRKSWPPDSKGPLNSISHLHCL